jgi:hypothetical protein
MGIRIFHNAMQIGTSLPAAMRQRQSGNRDGAAGANPGNRDHYERDQL